MRPTSDSRDDGPVLREAGLYLIHRKTVRLLLRRLANLSAPPNYAASLGLAGLLGFVGFFFTTCGGVGSATRSMFVRRPPSKR